MKHLSFKKCLAGIFTILTAVTLLASCSKSNPHDPRRGYPKDVSIEYRVKSPSGLTVAHLLSYDNESGGSTDANNSPLPFSKKFSKKVEFAEILSISVAGPTGVAGTITLEILVDDKVVETKSFTTNGSASSSASGSVSYQFD